jgi:hypothetical protein
MRSASVATYCVHHRDTKRSLGVAMTRVALAGCSSSGGGGQTSCALALEYEGRTYYSLKAAKPVTGSDPLAPEVRFSVCDDSGGQDEPGTAEKEDAAARFQAMTLKASTRPSRSSSLHADRSTSSSPVPATPRRFLPRSSGSSTISPEGTRPRAASSGLAGASGTAAMRPLMAADERTSQLWATPNR